MLQLAEYKPRNKPKYDYYIFYNTNYSEFFV